MKKIIISCVVFIVLFICETVLANAEKKFVVHIDNKVLEYKQEVFGDSMRLPDVIQIYPDKIYTLRINNKTKLLVMKSGGTIIYISSIANELKVLKYVYDLDISSHLKEIAFYDLDGDQRNEIITIWGDENAYSIRVHRVKLMNGEIDIDSIFNSADLSNPDVLQYERRMCVYKGSLYFLYWGYGSTHKIAILTRNPDDPTGELYLKPLGIATQEEWTKMEVKSKKSGSNPYP
jgi:hypothetical protein